MPSGSRRVLLTLLCATLAFLFVFSAYARAAEDTDMRTIIAAGSASGAPSPTKAALANAIDNAVAVGMTYAVPTEILNKNYGEFSQYILRDAANYVQSYKVLAEGKLGQDANTIVEVQVTPAKIKTALEESGLLAEAGFLSNIAILIETNDILEPESESKEWWRVPKLNPALLLSTNTLGNALGEKGFSVLPAESTHARVIKGILNNAEPTDTDIQVVAKAVDADAVILGDVKVVARQDAKATGNYHVLAEAELRVFEVATGKTLCTVKKQGGAVSDDQEMGANLALIEVANLAAEDLAACLGKKGTVSPKTAKDDKGAGTETSLKSQKITVDVVGKNRTMDDLVSFRQAIDNLDNVTDMNVNSMGFDNMRISFMYAGSPKNLADEIEAVNFTKFNARVTANGRDFVHYELVELVEDEAQLEIVEEEKAAETPTSAKPAAENPAPKPTVEKPAAQPAAKPAAKPTAQATKPQANQPRLVIGR